MVAVRRAALRVILLFLLASCGPGGGDPTAELLTFQARGSWQSQVVIWAADARHLEVALYRRESACRVAFHGVYADWAGVRVIEGFSDHIVPCRVAPQL